MRWDFIFVWLASKAKFRKKGIRHDSMNECLNCNNDLHDDHLFCPDCGQKIHNSKLSIWTLIAEFFAGIFNLENGLYTSLKWLPVPGYLSRKFMEGKRKRYLNPIRFFLVALIIHIAVLTDIIPLDAVSRGNIKSMEKLGQTQLHDEFIIMKDSLAERFSISEIDSLESVIFRNVPIGRDSFTLNGPNTGGGAFINSSLTEKTYRVKKADLYELTMDEFMDNYNLNTYWEKAIATQILRAVRDTSGALRFAIGNLIWIIFSVILLEGLFMKLLYIRRKRYYVEHLVVLFNVHTFAFLVASLMFWIGHRFIGYENNLDDIAILINAVFFFLSIKYYYRQGWIKSFIKFLMIGLVYLISLISMILLVTIVSFFFFQ